MAHSSKRRFHPKIPSGLKSFEPPIQSGRADFGKVFNNFGFHRSGFVPERTALFTRLPRKGDTKEYKAFAK